MHVPVREHYTNAPYHHRKDLTLLEEIIRERHPEMLEAAEKYLAGTVCYFGNIYIMRREVFYGYCAWLFPVLEEFDRQADLTDYTPQERRVDGYLAERLFGVWWLYVRSKLCGLELPRVHMLPELKKYILKQIEWTVLPPGSKRRAWVKGVHANHM